MYLYIHIFVYIYIKEYYVTCWKLNHTVLKGHSRQTNKIVIGRDYEIA